MGDVRIYLYQSENLILGKGGKVLKKKKSGLSPAMITAGGSIIAFIIISLVISVILTGLDNPVKYIDYAAIASALLTGLFCGLLSRKAGGDRTFFLSMTTSGAIAALILVISLLFGGSGNLLLRLGIPLALIIGAAVVPIAGRFSSSSGDAKKRIKKLRKKRA